MKSEFRVGDKVVRRNIAATVKQLLGDDLVVVLLGAPQADGARTMVWQMEEVELVQAAAVEASAPSAPSAKAAAGAVHRGSSRSPR